MFGTVGRVLLGAGGVAWMIAMLAYGARRPSARSLAVLFAAAPGFQLAWAALVNEKGALLFVPLAVVPLLALAYHVTATIRGTRP